MEFSFKLILVISSLFFISPIISTSLHDITLSKATIDLKKKDKLPICNTIYGTDHYWNEWSNCSALCGEGVQFSFLTREGVNAANKKDCEIVHRTRACNGTQCAVDCVLSDWTSNDTCNLATGYRTKTRTILVQPEYNGIQCDIIEKKEPCVVDCTVGEWSEFGLCNLTTGFKERFRNITYLPLNEGAECPPLSQKIDCVSCNATAWKSVGDCDKSTGQQLFIRDILESDGQEQCPSTKYEDCPVNCEVTEWRPWGNCNPSTGQQSRTRDIITNALNDGTPCGNILVGTNLIEVQDCPVDCQVSDWHDETTCNGYTKQQKQTRDIIVYPRNNGIQCPELQQALDCTNQCDQVVWSEWSDCDPATGYKFRIRDGTIDPSTNETICTTNETALCPVNAVVGNWGPWTDLQVKKIKNRRLQEKIAHRYRIRPLLVTPKNGGKQAPSLIQYDTDEIECPTSVWSSWTACDDLGNKYRYRESPLSSPEFDACNGTEDIQTCPVDCKINSWTAWGECDPFTGFRNKTTTILQNTKNGGNECPNLVINQQCVECPSSDWSPYSECFKNNGTKYSTREVYVNSQGCSSIKYTNCSVDCETTPFGVFTECNQHGQQSRQREIIVQPLNNGAECPALIETVDCPVDCIVSNWTTFSECNNSTNLKTRTRHVIRNDLNGGASCPALIETENCGHPCKTSNWSSWSTCDKTTGTMTRSRDLIENVHDNDKCILSETISCPVSCELSTWPAYTECNKTTGYKYRERQIKIAPLNNGTSCNDVGNLKEKTACPVDCEVSGWLAYSECSSAGFERRYKNVTVTAKNGGSNAQCIVSETRRCAVDCVIKLNGTVTTDAKNGGKSCYDVATRLKKRGIKIDPNKYSRSTSNAIFLQAFGLQLSKQQMYVGSSALFGTMAILLVGIVLVRRSNSSRRGYARISERPSAAV